MNSNNSISAMPAQSTSVHKPERDFNLDIIRIIAFIFIPGVHFFLHSGFYSQKVTTDKIEVMLLFRTLFLLCIPLFLLLTGYLQGEKKISPDKRYFFKIGKFLIPYLIIMLIDLVLIDEVLIPNLGWEKYNTKTYIQNFTSFTHYSWYVEMYIGLFLLIPFLNMIWQNLKTKRKEHFLLISLIAITILPAAFNVYDFSADNWFSAESTSNWKLFPSFWTDFYPITYYFTGAYLARHKSRFKINPFIALGLFLATWLCFGTYVIARMQNLSPAIKAFSDYNSPGIYLMGVTLFIFINSIPFGKVPHIIRRFAGKLSDLTFGAYLGSWALDQLLYVCYINKKYPIYEDRWSAYPFAMLIVIPTAFVISYLADLLYRTGREIFKRNKKPSKTE